MKTVKTPKGTELPISDFKGRDYLMVAYRIQWFNEEVQEFDIKTEFIKITEDETICRATVKAGLKSATASKYECKPNFCKDKKGFIDHMEKAETGAIGRCLAMLGYGTQFAISDLDEGERLADAPLESNKHQINSSNKFKNSL